MVELKIMQIIGTSSPFFLRYWGSKSFSVPAKFDHPNDLTTQAITINDASRGTTNVFSICWLMNGGVKCNNK
jgi:hypothetical protein